MAEPRWVVVDDADDGIQYSSGWTVESGAKWDKEGNFGATYRGTLHSSVSEGTFSYTYEGSRGRIYGTTNIRNGSNVIDPSWECQVDGTTVPPVSRFPHIENNWILCEWDNVAPGRHTVSVNVKSSGQAFLFDYLRYVPSPSANVQNAAIFVSHRDAVMQFGDGWQRLDTTARFAADGGASVTIPFYGAGISWYGIIPIELPPGSTTAEYTLDDSDPTSFSVPGPYGGTSQFNQLIFSLRDLARGPHTLKVTSRGQTSLTPLVILGVIIEGGSTQEPDPPPSMNNTPNSNGSTSNTTKANSTQGSSSLSSGSNPSQTSNPSGNTLSNGNTGSNITTNTSGGGNDNGGNSASDQDGTGSRQQLSESGDGKPPIAAIAGGVAGAVLLIALIVLLGLCYRRKNRKSRPVSISGMVDPFYRNGPTGTTSDIINEKGSLGMYSDIHGSQQVSSVGAQITNILSPVSPAQTSQYFNTPCTLRSFNTSQTGVQTNRVSHSTNPSTPWNSSPSSEVGVSSTMAGSANALLQNTRGPANEKYLQSLNESLSFSHPPTTSGSRIINHEDSGLRLTPQRPPTEILEYPPSYTPA